MSDVERAIAGLVALRNAPNSISVTVYCDDAKEIVDYIDSFRRRERELLEANNRYLKRARAAERGLINADRT